MVSRVGSRHRVVVAGGVAELVVVAAIAAKEPTGGVLSVAAALVLAPIAVAAVARVAARVASGRFPAAAVGVYVLLPLAASAYMLSVYRPTFDSHALPALVGLQSTGAFALGVAIVAAAAFLPRPVAAGAGLVALIAALAVWGTGDLGGLKPRLHETAWSVALPQWLVVASILGLALRSPALAAVLGGVLVAAILRASHQPYDNGDFWRALGVGAPAAALLVSSLGLLVPRLRPARREPAPAPPAPS